LKTVTARTQSCRTVVWAIDTFGGRLVDELGPSFTPFLGEGEVMPFETQLELFKKKLIHDRDQMVSADRAYRDQRAQETLVRGRRDAAVKEVNRDMVGLHDAMKGVYSAEKLAELGFPRRMPRGPEQLSEQASYLNLRLSDPDLDLSGARFEFQVEASNLVGSLSGSSATLKQEIDELAREERETEALKLAKDDALDRYNNSFLWIARAVESLLRLAGLDEVARRVRPSSRRKGETEVKGDPTEDGTTEGEASSEASPSEAATSEAPSSETASA
jgi:hypothetical protein